MKKFSMLASLVIFSASSAFAQNTVPNPLHKQEVQKQEQVKQKPQKETSVAAAPTDPAAVEKPKRERSEKQKQSDEDMRACGKSWGDAKDELKAKGETWRSYLKTCRAQLKSTRGA